MMDSLAFSGQKSMVKISLKLENLNKVNGWIDGAAHDALVDVRVCVALANILSKDERRWRQVLKAMYEKQFASGQCYTYLSAHLGSKKSFCCTGYVHWTASSN